MKWTVRVAAAGDYRNNSAYTIDLRFKSTLLVERHSDPRQVDKDSDGWSLRRLSVPITGGRPRGGKHRR